jgi:hypothetical protein
MTHRSQFLAALLVGLVCIAHRADAAELLHQPLGPSVPRFNSPPGSGSESRPLPKGVIGRWRIVFANQVMQACEVRADGTESVDELLLEKDFGSAAIKADSIVVAYNGGRTQRWSRVGNRMIVEHWCSGETYPTARPVVGIAERISDDALTNLQYADSQRGFRLSVPENWWAHCGEDRALQLSDAPPGNLITGREQGAVYIELGEMSAPTPDAPIGDLMVVQSDLTPLLEQLVPIITADGQLSTYRLAFENRGRRWSLVAHVRKPVNDEAHARVREVLRSVQFTEPQRSGQPVASFAGRWSVEFANSVKQSCEIHDDGTATVVEPLRRSGGRTVNDNGSTVIVFADDRLERWTPVGSKMVVEHWYPAARFATGSPVLGIGDAHAVTRP